MKNLALQRKWLPIAKAMITEHGLVGWHFKFNKNKRRLGVCKYRNRMIELSIYIFSLGDNEVRNTILHEIAHAKVGPTHGHNHVWRSAALAIGCTGDRCGGVMLDAPARYIGTCSTCNATLRRFKKTRYMNTTACAKCCRKYNGGKYDSRFIVTWRTS